MRFLILIILSAFVILPLPTSAKAQEVSIEREQDLDKTLTLTLYGNRYIVATFILPDSNMLWHKIHPYVPSETLKLDNPTLTPEELKVRLFSMRKPLMNEYTFVMDRLEGQIANKYPQHAAPNLQLQIGEFLAADQAENLVQLFPEFKTEIMEADEANKKVAAFMFLDDIVDYNIGLLKIAKEKQKELDLKKKEDAAKTENQE